MSSEGAASQPPAAGSEKPQAPKATPGFSSFINKSGAGKKFAPKAARRRPGTTAPTAPAAPATSTSATTDVSPTAVPTESQNRTAPATVPQAESGPQQTESFLPTPVATQESSTSITSQVSHAVDKPSTIGPQSTSARSERLPTPEPTPVHANPPSTQPRTEHDGTSAQLPSSRVTTFPLIEGEVEPHRSQTQEQAENRSEEGPQAGPDERLSIQESSLEDGGLSVETHTPDIQNPAGPTLSSSFSAETTETVHIPTPASTATGPETESGTEAGATSETQATDVSQVPAPEKLTPRRTLPWNPVNRPRQEDEENIESHTRTRPYTRTRGKRNVATNETVDGDQVEEAEQEEAEDEEYEEDTRQKTRTTRTRGKRRAAEVSGEREGDGDAASTAPPAKKARKPRKDKGTTRKRPSAEIEMEGQEGEEGAPPPTRKKRASRKKKTQPSATEEGAEGETEQSKRKGRPPRAPTPSDAEDETIDPSEMVIGALARDIRKGKLSEREKKMRKINWVEVRQRWREEAAMETGVEARNAVNERLEQAGEARNAATTEQGSGPQMRIVDGEITWVQNNSTTQRDRDADGDRDLEEMVEVQEDDLTTRITSHSFLKNNKRFPKEFIMPGQGARWTPEGTEQFYDALATFGTDFAMVATMFPGLTRRSIKMKFNREERDDPARIRRVLNGPRKNADWADYLTQSGRTDDSYVDADEIMRQLAAEREEMELQIQAALEAKEEQRRQRVAAGLPVTDDEGAGEKDGGGKKKKRGKNREKQAKGFAVEAGVEIVDDVAGFSD